MELRQIGVVRSEIKTRKEMPTLGSPAAIELLPGFEAGLLRFEKHSHIWVLAWLDQAERDILQVTPRGVTDQGPEGLHGVFAVRSPARPNPIGLTACRVRNVEGRLIRVDRLDFIDGTPVLDLKPYFVTKDAIFSAVNSRIGLPATREALQESLLMQACNFHGEQCADLALGVRIVEDYRVRFHDMGEPERWRIAAPASRLCMVDALMGMTRTSLGRGMLKLHDTDSVKFFLEDGSAEYAISLEVPGDPQLVLRAPEQVLWELWTSSTTS